MKTIDAALMRAATAKRDTDLYAVIAAEAGKPRHQVKLDVLGAAYGVSNWLTGRTLPGIRPTLERSGEREAREKLEQDVTDIKVVAYDELRHLERLSPEALQQAGYADLAAATQLVMQLAKQGILAKHTEFRARYPVR